MYKVKIRNSIEIACDKMNCKYRKAFKPLSKTRIEVMLPRYKVVVVFKEYEETEKILKRLKLFVKRNEAMERRESSKNQKTIF